MHLAVVTMNVLHHSLAPLLRIRVPYYTFDPRRTREKRMMRTVARKELLMTGFHHSVAVLPLPFRRFTVVK